MKPLLIHIHLYYPHLWPELRGAAMRIEEQGVIFHLVVTMVENHPSIAAEIAERWPEAELRIMPNLGYDIAPFMEILNSVKLEDYSYIIKLHTKRDVVAPWVQLCAASPFNLNGSRWRETLLAFIQPENWECCLQTLQTQPKLGMLAHHLVICPRVSRKDKKTQHTWLKAVDLLKTLGLPEPPNQRFVMGSMFMCRAELLKPLQELKLKPADFSPPDPDHIEETLAHVIERCLGAVITAQGYEIADCFSTKWDYVREWIQYLMQRFGHFIYSRKHTRRGKLIVKICKIPVYYSDARK